MKSHKKDVQEESEASVETVVQRNTEFALALYQKLQTTEGNLFFSPYSISTALAMTYAGARGNTADQIAQALHFPLEQEALHQAFASLEAKLNDTERKGHVQLKAANALWPQEGYPFLAEFLTLTKQYYGALITAVDYSDTETARRTINTWVEQKTENKIKELIPPDILDPLTCLVLVNAIYFKGNWANRFDPNLTRDAPFWITPDVEVQVPMMTQEREFRYGESDGLHVLELPYAGDALSMNILLPKEINGLARLEERLTIQNLARWTQKLWSTKVHVFLPKFKITFPFRLDDTLKSMGMVDAFGNADFSGMDGTRSLLIGAVLHKAFVDINEEGTEAAAATAVIMSRGPALVFRADHPFVFLIRENCTGSILFLGRMVNPGNNDDRQE